MSTKKLVKKIAEFHKKYKDEFLKDRIKKKNIYLRDPKEALFFIFSFSFYQGRKDELSKRYEERAKESLEEFLKETDPFSSIFKRIHKKV